MKGTNVCGKKLGKYIDMSAVFARE